MSRLIGRLTGLGDCLLATDRLRGLGQGTLTCRHRSHLAALFSRFRAVLGGAGAPGGFHSVQYGLRASWLLPRQWGAGPKWPRRASWPGRSSPTDRAAIS